MNTPTIGMAMPAIMSATKERCTDGSAIRSVITNE
jgi:hypothetical protein